MMGHAKEQMCFRILVGPWAYFILVSCVGFGCGGEDLEGQGRGRCQEKSV